MIFDKSGNALRSGTLPLRRFSCSSVRLLHRIGVMRCAHYRKPIRGLPSCGFCAFPVANAAPVCLSNAMWLGVRLTACAGGTPTLRQHITPQEKRPLAVFSNFMYFCKLNIAVCFRMGKQAWKYDKQLHYENQTT